jgi:hypothetical protein
MKRLIVFVLFILAATVLFADLETEIQLYDSAETQVGKLSVLQDVIRTGGADVETFCAQALDKLLLSYSQISGALELRAADSIAQITTERLGEAKYMDAAGNIWRVVNTLPNALSRSTALIALGKMKAVNYLPQTVRILEDLNTHPVVQDRQNAEELARGAIIALENFGDAAGYHPVYFASQGWYSERIKRQALASLAKIPGDASDSLIAIIKGSGYSYADKVTALDDINADSSASKEKKAEAAAAALSEGWRSSTDDSRMRTNLAGLRKQAIIMIGQYGASADNTELYRLLDRSYREGYDEDEKFGAVNTLSVLASVDAVRLLSSYLIALNVKLQDNTLVEADERMVRVLIPALGATRRPNARIALRTVGTVNWTSTVKRLAEDALRNIPSGSGNN